MLKYIFNILNVYPQISVTAMRDLENRHCENVVLLLLSVENNNIVCSSHNAAKYVSGHGLVWDILAPFCMTEIHVTRVSYELPLLPAHSED